jgi:uncharacterized protein YcbK (DUF882 family)
VEVVDYTTFCHAVGFLCQTLDASVTSWWRSPKRNAAVGGHANSLHKQGLGCDLVLDDMSSEKRTELVKMATDLGLRALDEGDHIHLQVVTG